MRRRTLALLVAVAVAGLAAALLPALGTGDQGDLRRVDDAQHAFGAALAAFARSLGVGTDRVYEPTR